MLTETEQPVSNRSEFLTVLTQLEKMQYESIWDAGVWERGIWDETRMFHDALKQLEK